MEPISCMINEVGTGSRQDILMPNLCMKIKSTSTYTFICSYYKIGIFIKKEVDAMNIEEKMAKNGISKHEVEEIHKEMHYQLSITLNRWR